MSLPKNGMIYLTLQRLWPDGSYIHVNPRLITPKKMINSPCFFQNPGVETEMRSTLGFWGALRADPKCVGQIIWNGAIFHSKLFNCRNYPEIPEGNSHCVHVCWWNLPSIPMKPGLKPWHLQWYTRRPPSMQLNGCPLPVQFWCPRAWRRHWDIDGGPQKRGVDDHRDDV